MSSTSFNSPELARAVEALTLEAVNALPFGAVHLDSDGKVLVFSNAEADLSGYGTRPALGRQFFTEIAPCMNNPSFRGRIDRALAAGKLDIEFSYVGDFNDEEKDLRVRIQSATGGGCWIFIQRE
jgi:photoactive yellow protein